jgi:hypothetical protein
MAGFVVVCVCVCGAAEVITQGLHLEPLHQPFSVMGVFELRSFRVFGQADVQL